MTIAERSMTRGNLDVFPRYHLEGQEAREFGVVCRICGGAGHAGDSLANEEVQRVFHVHAKDTFLNAPVLATTSLLESVSLMNIPARCWSYITLGFGHGEEWWR